mmetsp:Transcript_35036/g.69637  ORF Transcript_35036/g.69637 Transcript_35036/m.69637 type:complete len:219 (+) Transcript_35036:613-1269(+)
MLFEPKARRHYRRCVGGGGILLLQKGVLVSLRWHQDEWVRAAPSRAHAVVGTKQQRRQRRRRIVGTRIVAPFLLLFFGTLVLGVILGVVVGVLARTFAVTSQKACVRCRGVRRRGSGGRREVLDECALGRPSCKRVQRRFEAREPCVETSLRTRHQTRVPAFCLATTAKSVPRRRRREESRSGVGGGGAHAGTTRGRASSRGGGSRGNKARPAPRHKP